LDRGGVKTLSYAVGMEKLSETYKAVLSLHETKLSVRLIDVSIKLDHFGSFPESRLDRLYRLTKDDNIVAFIAVRSLLVGHYQLYRTTHRMRQKFAKLFGIEMTSTRLVEGGLLKD
jgi:hypothetical protein